MPNYRRNRIPGGTYFFTVTLRDRNSVCWSRTSKACGKRCAMRSGNYPSISRPGSFCPTIYTVCGRFRPATAIFPTAGDGSKRGSRIAARGGAGSGQTPQERARHLAARSLGAYGPRRARLCGAHGLHPFQPGKARFSRKPGRLALLQLPAMRGGRALSRGLACRRRAGRDRRTMIDFVGRVERSATRHLPGEIDMAGYATLHPPSSTTIPLEPWDRLSSAGESRARVAPKPASG